MSVAVVACDRYQPSANPRNRGCERCGVLPKHHERPHPAAEYFNEPRTQPRNQQRERALIETASRAVGLPSDAGLWSFADQRAAPGGVRENLDAVQEICEELADAANYAVWGIEAVYDRMLAGDSEATSVYERLMRSLSAIVTAWDALVRV